jgi:hypothetical protein
MKALRIGGGILAGFVVAWLCVSAAEMGVHRLYPPPPGTDLHDMEQVRKFVASLPLPPMLMVLAGWLCGTLAGTFAAARLARSRVAAYVVGAVLLAAGIANAILIPQPLWFSIVSFAIYIGMTVAGARLGAPASAVPAAAR